MLKKAATVLIALLVVCALLEVVLRTTHLFHARISWTEPDRDIGWRFTPGREYWFFGENDHAITGRINALGWRDRERSVDKPEGTFRIAVLGDSYVEAFQVEQDSTFVARAERAFQRVHPPAFDHVEVMNFGRSGMSPAEESIVLERDVFPCHPNAVLVLFTPQNDIADVSRSTAADKCRPFPETRAGSDVVTMDKSFVRRRDFRVRERINVFKQHSALVSLVIERYNAARLARAQHVARDTAGWAPELGLCTAHPDPVFVKNYTLCKKLIEAMAFACRERGILFELGSVPLVYEQDAVVRAKEADPSFNPGYFDEDLAALAEAGGFVYVPMTAGFALRSLQGVKLQWQHWNYRGHEAAFELLLNPGTKPVAAPDSSVTH